MMGKGIMVAIWAITERVNKAREALSGSIIIVYHELRGYKKCDHSVI